MGKSYQFEFWSCTCQGLEGSLCGSEPGSHDDFWAKCSRYISAFCRRRGHRQEHDSQGMVRSSQSHTYSCVSYEGQPSTFLQRSGWCNSVMFLGMSHPLVRGQPWVLDMHPLPKGSSHRLWEPASYQRVTSPKKVDLIARVGFLVPDGVWMILIYDFLALDAYCWVMLRIFHPDVEPRTSYIRSSLAVEHLGRQHFCYCSVPPSRSGAPFNLWEQVPEDPKKGPGHSGDTCTAWSAWAERLATEVGAWRCICSWLLQIWCALNPALVPWIPHGRRAIKVTGACLAYLNPLLVPILLTNAGGYWVWLQPDLKSIKGRYVAFSKINHVFHWLIGTQQTCNVLINGAKDKRISFQITHKNYNAKTEGIHCVIFV